MQDSFFKNWGSVLDRLAEQHSDSTLIPEPKTQQAAPPDEQIGEEAVESAAGDAVLDSDIDSPEQQPLRKLEVRTFGGRLPKYRIKTFCFRFDPDSVLPDMGNRSATFGFPAKPSSESETNPRPQPRTSSWRPQVIVPPNVPLRDRLFSRLQPPTDILMGDNRLWLPFEPFPYQLFGIHFLSSHWSALLADEMGLGKTMQTIMAMRLLLRSGQIRSALIVCPKPLMTNWQRELKMWADEIPLSVVQGNSWTRRNTWMHDRSVLRLANYESVTRDEAVVNDPAVSFDLVVLDEAQRIKNPDSRISKVVRKIRRKRSWALTGTPVENQANELVSLLEFVHQTRLHQDNDIASLRELVGDVLLRRTKDMVHTDLPAKITRDKYIDLGPAQRERYDMVQKEGVLKLNDLGDHITIEHVFELIRRLKQICNFDPLTGESAKAEQLASELEEIADSGKKAIVFSQSVETIRRLTEHLARFRPLVYHGEVPQKHRDGILKEFKENKERLVILMSYGTGAVGLNLQFTNYVFLFDRWWNPATEDQAVNRAHRIGQKSKVFVFRYLTPNTIEERIAQILETKRQLFSELIDGHEPDQHAGLTRADVFGLFDLKLRG